MNKGTNGLERQIHGYVDIKMHITVVEFQLYFLNLVLITFLIIRGIAKQLGFVEKEKDEVSVLKCENC